MNLYEKVEKLAFDTGAIERLSYGTGISDRLAWNRED